MKQWQQGHLVKEYKYGCSESQMGDLKLRFYPPAASHASKVKHYLRLVCISKTRGHLSRWTWWWRQRSPKCWVLANQWHNWLPEKILVQMHKYCIYHITPLHGSVQTDCAHSFTVIVMIFCFHHLFFYVQTMLKQCFTVIIADFGLVYAGTEFI
jgi:hypothetical protein